MAIYKYVYTCNIHICMYVQHLTITQPASQAYERHELKKNNNKKQKTANVKNWQSLKICKKLLQQQRKQNFMEGILNKLQMTNKFDNFSPKKAKNNLQNSLHIWDPQSTVCFLSLS